MNTTVYRIKEFFINNKKTVLIVAGCVVVVGIVVALVLIFRNPSQNISSEQLQQSVEQETGELTTNVGEKMTLPTDETPIISTVEDKTQLEGEIFKDAENGDKVLIYQEAGLMVVYRESTKEIIATGSVKTGSIEDNSDVPAGVDQ